MLASYRGHYRVEHGGNIDGFSASTSFFPSDSIGIVVLSNQNGSAVPSIVRNILSDRMLGLKYRDWQTISKSADIKSKLAAIKADSTKKSDTKKQTSISHPLNDFTGIYNNPAYGNVNITEKQDSLFGKIGVVDLWLRHSSYDIFTAVMIDKKDGIDSSADGPVANFRADDAGNISSFTTKFDTQDNIEFVKKPAAIKISKDSLLPYVGIYELGGIEVKISLKGDDMITAFVPGQPVYDLVATGPDLFSLEILSGYSVKFERDESNKIVGLIFQQPNGNFSAKRKK